MMKNFSSKLIRLYLVILMLVLFGCAPSSENQVTSIADSNREKAPTPNVEANPTANLPGQFDDEQGGFALAYENDWKVIRDRQSIIRLKLAPVDPSFKSEISVTVISSNYETPEEFVRKELEKKKSSKSDSTGKVLDEGQTTVSGYPALYKKIQYPDRMIAYSIGLKYKTRRYMLLLRTEEGKFDQTYVSFLSLKDTFTIKP